MWSLAALKNFPRKLTQAAQEAQQASTDLEKALEKTLELYTAKLRMDEAAFKFWMEKLANNAELNRGLQRAKKLSWKTAGNTAATALVDNNFVYNDASDVIELSATHTAVIKDTVVPTLSSMRDASTLIVLDADGNEFETKLHDALVLLSKDPHRSAMIIMLHWKRSGRPSELASNL